MILSDGTDTREEVARPGPYCDGMAVVLDMLALEGVEDECYSIPAAEYGVRIGRRVLWTDSQGFMASDRYDDEAQASLNLRYAFGFVRNGGYDR